MKDALMLKEVLRVLLSLEITVPLTGALAGLLLGLVIHVIQKRRSRILPYLPSYSASVDTEHGSATRFFASVHDMTMCVTEAWNTTHSRRDGGTVEERLHHHQLYVACEGVREHGEEMMAGLSDYGSLSERVGSGRALLDQSWDYRSRDNYHTEHYTVTSTDSDGNTETEHRTRQVYDDTDHWFTFNSVMAKQAEQALDALTVARRSAHLVPPNVGRMTVKLENMTEAERLFLERLYLQTVIEDEKYVPSVPELERAVNQWLVSTTIDENLNGFEHNLDKTLPTCDAAFTTILGSRSAYHFNVPSRSHSGPPGFQAAKTLGGRLSETASCWHRVVHMWESCRETANTLTGWAQDGEIIETDKAYARQAVDAYELAFPDSSIDVDQLTTPKKTILIAVGVGVLVSLVVFTFHPDGWMSW